MTDISYNGVKEEDLFDRNFIFDIHVLITKNINPFSLERKIFDVKDGQNVYMFWNSFVNTKFYKHISLPGNFLYLNGKNVSYPKEVEIV